MPALAKTVEQVSPPPVEMLNIKLLRHYVPQGEPVNGKYVSSPAANHVIVGWHKPAVEKKNSAGIMTEVSPAEFVRDEMAPPPVAGAVGYGNKIWAKTVISVPKEEAKRMVRLGIGVVDVEDL